MWEFHGGSLSRALRLMTSIQRADGEGDLYSVMGTMR